MRFWPKSELPRTDKLAARDISGIVVLGDVRGNVIQNPAAVAGDLAIPWSEPRKGQSVLAWLSWKSRISAFTGRDEAKRELIDWAANGGGVRARFLSGEGGMGKTRLAAELAEELSEQDWAAGFVDLRTPSAFFTKNTGTLLVVDYPEENREGVRTLLENLGRLESQHAIRLLFLSRRGEAFWQPEIERAHAETLIDGPPVELVPLVGQHAFNIFTSAQQRVPREAGQQEPQPVTETAFEEWLQRAPDNQRPLFIAAAAIHSVLYPGQSVVGVSGQQVVRALVRRELARLAAESAAHRLGDHTLGRIAAFAAMRGDLQASDLAALAGKADLALGFPPPERIYDAVDATGRLVNGEFPAPTPDILAACLLVEVFAGNPGMAPEWLWSAIEEDIAAGLERMVRLSHDAEIVLGIHDHRISDWLPNAAKGKTARCHEAASVAGASGPPLGLVPLYCVVWRTLADNANDDAEKAHYLNNLSNGLSDAGDGRGALEAIRDAVETFRRLAQASPARYEPDLASSLNNLSNRLSDAGDRQGALEAIREAVEIRRRLAQASPARYEPDLALSLNNLSSHLSDAGDREGAIEAIREAVEIRRRLAAASPARYEPDLAMSLNNLSSHLSAAGDGEGALEPIGEAVEIRRRLAQASPARYEPDLALILNNLSSHLSDAGDGQGALEAIREAVEIYSRLAQASPARYEPDLASSLNNLSNRMSDAGEGEGALEAIREAVEIRRRLAQASPARYEPDLALSLNNLSVQLSYAGDGRGALEAIRQAVEIRRRLVAASPARYEPDLARSLSVLSDRWEGRGESERATEATREALRLMRPYAERYPGSANARLYGIMQDDLARLTGESTPGATDEAE